MLSPESSPSPMLSAIGRTWPILLLYGVAALGFGITAIGWPMAAATALAWVLGLMAIAEGVISLLALISGGSGAPRGWLLLYAVASLGCGAVAGVYRIVFALRVRRHIRGEWVLILSGVLAIVLGLLFAANPLAGVAVTTLWIGIGSLLYGLLQIVVALKLRKLR